MSIAEQEKPQIHMVWPTSEHPSCPAVAPASGYTIRAFQDGDEQAFLNLMSLSDFDPWDDEKLSGNINKIIPGGWFFAVDSGGQIVATAMGQHNYSGLSPFTGDVGWVFCHPDHRGNGLGLALCARVTQRFLDAGYTKIQLHTEQYRLPAIKVYLKLGYVPAVASSEDASLEQQNLNRMSEDINPDRIVLDAIREHRDAWEQREHDVDQLRSEVLAHQRLLFPLSCKGRTVRKTPLEQSVGNFYASVAAFLASDHRKRSFPVDARTQMENCLLAFDIVLNRSVPRQRLNSVDRDYFTSLVDIRDHLEIIISCRQWSNLLPPDDAS